MRARAGTHVLLLDINEANSVVFLEGAGAADPEGISDDPRGWSNAAATPMSSTLPDVRERGSGHVCVVEEHQPAMTRSMMTAARHTTAACTDSR
ncbi:hypothetical protein FHS42_006154 [Streptomyces zagrosensis]|uniref:Uncharacterized protein n=1 Tax=Streptomyces zagrosensis TaxID=1042984 RepID=A0A7W9V1L7_9ACTN|nr:hypothetical protein [Streptomyces zagrosensis]